MWGMSKNVLLVKPYADMCVYALLSHKNIHIEKSLTEILANKSVVKVKYYFVTFLRI